MAGGDEQKAMVGLAMSEATRPKGDDKDKDEDRSADGDAIVMGSGNLGLVYLMQENRRLTLEEMDAAHPRLIPELRDHPHVGWILVRSQEHGAMVLGGAGSHRLADGHVEGEDPLAPFSPEPRRICCAPTASPTWPTSWSAAFTTRCGTRAVHLRS